MAKNNKREVQFFVRNQEQLVRSSPRKIFVKRYLSAKGVRLVNEGKMSPKFADEIYGRNLYRINKDSVVIKKITHKVHTKTFL